jgi:hypothetical protein
MYEVDEEIFVKYNLADQLILWSIRIMFDYARAVVTSTLLYGNFNLRIL